MYLRSAALAAPPLAVASQPARFTKPEIKSQKTTTSRKTSASIAMAASIAALSFAHAAPAFADPIPAQFTSTGEDRRAIEALLTSYTRAVSTKNQALFESLLLDKTIPFSGIGATDRSNGATVKIANYDDFCKSVFHGPPFTQRFQDIHIDQDGRLAIASLVFVNTDADGASWGWKTLQLLKVSGRWKIASEFYTGHSGSTPKEH